RSGPVGRAWASPSGLRESLLRGRGRRRGDRPPGQGPGPARRHVRQEPRGRRRGRDGTRRRPPRRTAPHPAERQRAVLPHRPDRRGRRHRRRGGDPAVIFVLMLAIPLAGALAMLVPAHRFLRTDAAVRTFGAAVSGATLLVAISALTAFDFGATSRMQLEIDREWAPAIGLKFHLGADGISLPLVALTALLTFLCFLYTLRHPPEGGRARLLTAMLLVLEVGMLGTFVALDLVLFFVFFETVLIPMYVVIVLWGGEGRREAAYKFILYTLLGSGLLLAGMLLVGAAAGTLDMTELAARHGSGLTRGLQITAFALMGVGFAVKAPMWPLHTWLPDAHTAAPTVGSVLLAGVLLKMGTYGLVRVALPLAPEGARFWAPRLGLLAVVGIVYGALACLAQRDLKRMIAFSSVGHMGFVLLGIATLTPVGVNAALFGNIAHGLITGLLFFLAGAVKERWGTTDMDALG